MGILSFLLPSLPFSFFLKFKTLFHTIYFAYVFLGSFQMLLIALPNTPSPTKAPKEKKRKSKPTKFNRLKNVKAKQNSCPPKSPMKFIFVLLTIPGHPVCPGVWLTYPVTPIGENRLSLSQQVSIAIAPWLGGLSIYTAQLQTMRSFFLYLLSDHRR